MKIHSLAELELLEVQQYSASKGEPETLQPAPVATSPEIKAVEEEEKVVEILQKEKEKAYAILKEQLKEKPKESTYLQKVQDRLMEAVRLREERDFKFLDEETLAAQHGLLVRGYHKSGFIEKVEKPRDLIDFIAELTGLVESRRVCDFWVYSFAMPKGYTAWTNQASYDQLHAEGKAAQIKNDRKRAVHQSRYVKCCSDPYIEQPQLETAQFVTFVLHEQFGLLRWRPGVFIDLLPPNEHSAWVTVENQ